MATKRKTKNQFVKKHTRSKGFGRPALTEAEKELTLKTRTQFKMMLNKYMITDEEDLVRIYKASGTPVIDSMVIKSLLNALNSGDQSQINWFLNHTLGRERETTNINVTGNMENTSSIDLKKLTKEELLALRAMAEKNETGN